MQDRIQSPSALPALGQSAGAVLVPTVGSGEARNLTPLAGKVQNHSNPARVELDKASIVHKPSNTNKVPIKYGALYSPAPLTLL